MNSECAFQKLPVGLCHFDLDLRYVFITDWLAKLNGISVEGHMGRSIKEVLPHVAESITASLRQVIVTGDPLIDGEFTAETPAQPRVLRIFKHSCIPIKSDSGSVTGLSCVVEEVTDHNQLNGKSNQFREIFSHAFQSNPNLMALVDPATGEHFDVNEAWLTTLNFKREEVIGKTSFDLNHWADIHNRERVLKKHSEDGYVRNFIGQLKAKDGTLIDCSFSTEPIKMKHLEFVLWTVIDITEQRERENALSESEARYKDATRIANLGHWVYDEITSRLVYCSDELAKIHGVTPDHYLEMVSNTENNIERVHPDDQNFYEKVIKDAQRDNASFDVEYKIVRSDGEIRYIQEIGEPVFDDTGKLIQHRGTLQDITDLKRAEEDIAKKEALLQIVFDSMPSGIRCFDKDDNLLFFNARYSELWDLPDGLLKIGAPLRVENLYIAERGDYGEGNLDKLIDSVQYALPFLTESQRYERTTIKGRILDCYTEPTELGGYVSIHTDITDLKIAEDELRRAKEEAEKSDMAKSKFLAHMSHELRTPMNAIIGLSQLMLDEVFGEHSHPKYLEYSQDVRNSGHHLLAIINDILDLAKIESGEAALNEESFGIRDVVEDCTTMLQRRKSGHTERFDTEQVTKTMFLYGDKRLFRQIILNLLSNANKFTPDDGVIIVSSYVDGDDRTVVQVIDTGRGIASEDIPKALEPFGQARVDSLITHEGTGLGLPLSQKLMELHGGTLEIESELGVGTVVTITFPTERTVIVK